MTCASFEGFDLLAYLDDPRAESFAAFRAHYPGCPECAAEVREGTELRQLLEGARPVHPDPELLLRFEDARSGLDAQEATRIESHLRSCVTCREELDSLRGLDEAALGRAPAPPLRVRPTLGARLRWLLWQPALAYALLFAALAPQLYRALTSPAPLPAQSAPVPREEAPVPQRIPQPSRSEPLADAPAEEPVMSVAPPATSGPEVPAAPSVPQALPAQRPKPAARPKPAPLPAKPERPAAAEQKQAGDLPAPALEGSAMSDEAPPAPEPEVESEALVAPPAARAQRSESAPPAEPLPELRMLRRRASAPEPQAPGVTLTRGTSSIEVRLPLPAFATPGNPVALVLRDVEGGRELREGRVVTIGATFLSIDLPLAWATPGSYQAEVIDARPRATRQAATYSFSID